MRYLYSNKYWELAKEYNFDKLLYLMIDRPDEINYYNNNHTNDFIWKNNKKQYHRDYDLPAYVYCYDNGICSLSWRTNKKFHRENINNPTIIYTEGYKEYYVNGKFIKEEWVK